jgi:hypothetical protein
MLEDLDSAAEIARLTDGLLRRADAAGQWPTPVDAIVAATALSEPTESPLSASVLREAPKHLRKAIALLTSSKVRALLDRRERAVYVDGSIGHEGRRSFLRLHEVTHDLLPWQQELAYADDDATLSRSIRMRFEREANQGAAELLFQGRRFAEMAGGFRVDMASVCQLADDVGASLQATLRRFCETHHAPVCGVVLDPSPAGREPLRFRRREVSQSRAWTARFGCSWPAMLSVEGFPFLAAAEPGAQRTREALAVTWPDLDCEPVDIRAEALSNRFGVLLLLWVPQRERFKRKRVLHVAGATA